MLIYVILSAIALFVVGCFYLAFRDVGEQYMLRCAIMTCRRIDKKYRGRAYRSKSPAEIGNFRSVAYGARRCAESIANMRVKRKRRKR
jgi:hypothetical protein